MSLSTLRKMFQTDAKLESEGIDLNYGPADDANPEAGDVIIRIRRAGGANKEYSKALTSKMRPYRKQVEAGTLDNGVAERVLREVYAETVVIGWKNVKGEDGKDIPFSADAVKDLFSDMPDLFVDVQTQATQMALFRAEVAESIAKNS